MRLKFVLVLLILSMSACTALGTPVPTTEPPSVPSTETATPTEAPNTLPPYQGDTPSPPTIAAPLVSSPGITSLRMLNELDGWAMTDNAILRTTDGGVTWYNVSPSGVTTFGFGTGHTFLSVLQAWVLVAETGNPAGSGQLYRTGDGGLTWTTYPVPFGGGDLTFLDETHGWMMASLGAGAGSMAVAIYRSDDGGQTWTQTFTDDPNQANAGDSLPLGGIKNNLTPLDGNTAWVGGVIYAPETFYFYKTADGGQTWTQQSLPAAPGMQNTDLSIDTGPIFFNSSDGILPVRFTGETQRTGFYATHDGGTSWVFVTFVPGSGTVDFVSPSDGFFWTGEQFFVTADRAQTWMGVSPNLSFGDTFAGMDFVNTYTGWVWTNDGTGQYGLYKTTDGGATWSPLGT